MRISATNGSAMRFLLRSGCGKMPKSEMMKSTQRYGCKLSCGWLPPTEVTDAALSGVDGLKAA